jgi:glycosyltransferase involved in cell wall biosynthesis
MKSNKQQFTEMTEKLNSPKPSNWSDITEILSDIKENALRPEPVTHDEFLKRVSKGFAFWTFDFGIDGVSIEISKYAQCLQEILPNEGKTPVHFIAGDFHPQADSVIKPGWHRFRIAGANGWSKWDNGKWFEKLFYQDMNENSKESDEMAVEVWKQAVRLTEKVGEYLAENEISLLIPVNVNSNPGNLATGLCTVLVSELMGVYVLNSNHDFFWEDGKPASQRKPGEAPGSRDKFFRNVNNRSFFSLLEKVYPWDGRRWIQVNINKLQSKTLIRKYGFSANRVFEVLTCISDAFFRDYSRDEIRSVRSRMAHILSDGDPIIHPISVEYRLSHLEAWMSNQKPSVCAGQEGLDLDLTSDDIIYFLQPTRIVDRKRIWRDMQLIGALLHHPLFLKEFESNKRRQIVLHITGPTPIEHQTDLEHVLRAFEQVTSEVPDSISNRLFLAFSVGTEEHSCFSGKGFERLLIEDIFRLADIVLFPSETEGRGLPILEASAAGIPIICSRYKPEEIFIGVVGEDLPEEQRIWYTPFPEGDFSESFLDEVSELVFFPENNRDRIEHNKRATRLRYSDKIMRETFENYLMALANTR